MRLTKLTWAGISLIATAVIGIGVWSAMLKTAINKPIDVPLTVLKGSVRTPAFKVNRNRLYTIEVVAKKKTIPFGTLNCLLGMPLPAASCDKPSVIEASWSLSSNGKLIVKGKSDGDPGGAWTQDDIARELGRFQSESGRTYDLSVDFITDASVLASAEPHLKVEISTDYYEGDMFISFFLWIACVALIFSGLSLLIASTTRSLMKRRRGAAM
jgi:hypothetical protein